MRKLRAAALRSLVAGLLCLASMTVHANGRLPGATGLAINPADERQLLLGLSYGLALTRDRLDAQKPCGALVTKRPCGT